MFIFTTIMFFGGFWAQQEFNWGGWWNWDFVELSILLLCLFWLIFFHISFKKRIFNFMCSLFILLYCLYFSINRWGLSVSIHKFVQSFFFSNFYFYLYFICIMFFFKKKKLIFIFFTSINIVFLVREFIFLKLFFFFYYCLIFRALYIYVIHIITLVIYSIFYLFNMFNINYICFYIYFNFIKSYFVEDFFLSFDHNSFGLSTLLFNFKLCFIKISSHSLGYNLFFNFFLYNSIIYLGFF